ncbi:MAG: DUF2254 domain-containing protein [Singulisphaera sp.]|nr:DUF2254 domain-containing protein [Singulisphaera sp.]
MTWLQRHRVRHYVGNSIWILPVLGMVAALGAVRLLNWVDAAMGWRSGFHPEAARTVLGTLSSSMFTLIVFVSSALLVAVQLASAQLTPRVIAIVFKDPVTKFSLAAFVFAFTFTLAALVRIEDSVPLVTSSVAAYGCVASLGVFLYLIDHMGKALRPSGAARSVASLGRRVIESVYPRRLAESPDTSPDSADVPGGEPSDTITSPTDGVVLAFDVRGLVSLAERADCVIELVPQVGDFVATKDALFRVFRGGATLTAGELRGSVALGQERTLEQDPAFAFRILVDMASKGLSPGINDPTTAVLALDQIHHLLRTVGDRHLGDGRVRDAAGRLRLVYRTPDWADFVHLAVTEIRHFGAASIQVARRLRAMLEDLIEGLPEERAALLRPELALLHRSAERSFPDPEDQALADISDVQGVGGKYGQGRPSLQVNQATLR